jgi:hypothetical protein
MVELLTIALAVKLNMLQAGTHLQAMQGAPHCQHYQKHPHYTTVAVKLDVLHEGIHICKPCKGQLSVSV